MSHYEDRLERDIKRIRRQVERMGQSVLDALENATKSVLTGNRELATATIVGDLPINRQYRKLEEKAHFFVARHLPSAGHLRFVSAVLRLSKTLERVGDYAETISRASLQLSESPPERLIPDIEMMSKRARKTLDQSLKSFHQNDVDLARSTLAAASQFGPIFDKVFADLVKEGEEGTRRIPELFSLLAILNRFERVIHQAKNICEQTIFVVTGAKKAEKQLNVLFVDGDGSGQALLAAAVGERGYADVADFHCASWGEPASLKPDFASFAESKGLDIVVLRCPQFDGSALQAQDYDILIDLSGDAREHVNTIPFHTTLLTWKLQSQADPEGFHKELAPLLDTLMSRTRDEDDED